MKIKSKVTQVFLGKLSKESVLKVKSRKKDLQCSNCSSKYEDLDEDIALVMVEGEGCKHACEACGIHFISEGAEDIKAKVEVRNNTKEELIVSILHYESPYVRNGANTSYSNWKNLENKKIAELQEILVNLEEEEKMQMAIAKDIKENFVDTPTEDYLSDEHVFYEDKEYLKHHSDIVATFKDIGYDYFDCGQGYYEDEAEVLVKIGALFYEVQISAEVYGDKQDRGDRLYYVDSISKVTYEEVDKPQPRARIKAQDFAEGIAILSALPNEVLKNSEVIVRGSRIFFTAEGYITDEKQLRDLAKMGWVVSAGKWMFQTQ